MSWIDVGSWMLDVNNWFWETRNWLANITFQLLIVSFTFLNTILTGSIQQTITLDIYLKFCDYYGDNLKTIQPAGESS